MALRLATFVALVLTTTAVFPASHGTLGADIVVLAASHAAPTGPSPTSRCAPSVHCPSLTVRFKQQRGCHYEVNLRVNGGAATHATCLIEGHGFAPSESVHLSYALTLRVPLVQGGSARQWERPHPTPLPHVTCLMRMPDACRTARADSRGHFGPVWVRFTYLRGLGGDQVQGFTVNAYGASGGQASLIVPWTRVVT